MYIDAQYKPEKLKLDVTGWPHLHLDVEAKRLYATDGIFAVAFPVGIGEHDVSGPITIEALKAAKGRAILANGALQIVDGPQFPRPPAESLPRVFPDLRQVLPSLGSRAPVARMGLNAKVLSMISAALGCDQLRMEFNGDTGAVVLTPASMSADDPAAAIAVIMPYRCR